MIKNFSPAALAPSQSPGIGLSTDRLDSWKEIASYLRREVRTVQLWEKREGLPVHRHFHKSLGSVFALRSEIDRWKRQASRESDDQGPEEGSASTPAGGAGDRVTIYVLPLRNVTVTSERRRLCDAIVARTIAALEQVNPAGLGIVSPRLPVQQEEAEPAAQPSNDDKVDYVLQWSIQDDGKGLRVNVALSFAGTDAVAWSHTYRCRPTEFDDLPTYVADQIVQCLWLKVFSASSPVPVVGRRERPGS